MGPVRIEKREHGRQIFHVAADALLILAWGLALVQQTSGEAVALGGGSEDFDPAACGCSDIAPPGPWTCEQQRDFGKCQADWMVTPQRMHGLTKGYCQTTCGRCNCPGAPVFVEEGPAVIRPGPCSCTDLPVPGSPYTCEQQRSFGKCFAIWMRKVDGLPEGYCQITCGLCPCLHPEGVPSVQPLSPEPSIPSVPNPPVTHPSPESQDEVRQQTVPDEMAKTVVPTKVPVESITPSGVSPRLKTEKRPATEKDTVFPSPPEGTRAEAIPQPQTSPEPSPDPEPVRELIPEPQLKPRTKRGQNKKDKLAQVPKLEPAPEPEPEPDQEVVPEPQQKRKKRRRHRKKKKSDQVSNLVPEPEEELVPAPEPEPEPEPEQAAERELRPEPGEELESKPKLEIEPQQETVPTPAPEPVPQPENEPAPAPELELVPGPEPAPDPELVNEFVPGPAPEPKLELAPAREPEAELAPTPEVIDGDGFAPSPEPAAQDAFTPSPGATPRTSSRTPPPPPPGPSAPSDNRTELEELRVEIENINDYEDPLPPQEEEDRGPTKRRLQSIEYAAGAKEEGLQTPLRRLQQDSSVFSAAASNDAQNVATEEQTESCSKMEDLLNSPIGKSQFSIVSQLISKSGFLEDLRNPSLFSTLFVPTDEAFSHLPKSISLDQILNDNSTKVIEYIRTVFLYNMVPEILTTDDFQDGMSLQTIYSSAAQNKGNSDSASGLLSVRFARKRNAWLVENGKVSAKIQIPDVDLCGSVVQVVNRVLLPPEDTTLLEQPESCGRMEDLLNSPIGKTQFKHLSKLLTKSGLLEDLKSPTLFSTLFVPTDKAFDNLPKEINLDQILNDDSTRVINFIRKVFLFNMVPRIVPTDSFQDGMSLRTVYASAVNLQDDASGRLTVNFDTEQGSWSVKGGTVEAKIEIPDVDLCGSVVHVVDNVLLPPDPFTTFIPNEGESGICDTIVGMLQGPVSGGEFSILATLIERAGLLEELRNPAFSATIFAPTDAAIRSMPKPFCVEKVLNDRSPRAINEIQKLLLYHVVPRKLEVADLTDDLKIGTFLSSTLDASPGTTGAGELRIKKTKKGATKIVAADNEAKIVDGDLDACQSVIHFIDAVLVPTFNENVVELLTCHEDDPEAPSDPSLSKRDPMKDRRSRKEVRQAPEPPVAAAAEQPIFGVDFSSVKVEDLTG